METKKLTAKDFITIGIFTAIWFVVEFAFGMLGYLQPYIVAAYVVLLLYPFRGEDQRSYASSPGAESGVDGSKG